MTLCSTLVHMYPHCCVSCCVYSCERGGASVLEEHVTPVTMSPMRSICVQHCLHIGSTFRPHVSLRLFKMFPQLSTVSPQSSTLFHICPRVFDILPNACWRSTKTPIHHFIGPVKSARFHCIKLTCMHACTHARTHACTCLRPMVWLREDPNPPTMLALMYSRPPLVSLQRTQHALHGRAQARKARRPWAVPGPGPNAPRRRSYVLWPCPMSHGPVKCTMGLSYVLCPCPVSHGPFWLPQRCTGMAMGMAQAGRQIDCWLD